MRYPITTAAFAAALALAGCSSAVEPKPSGSETPAVSPGEASYVPPASEACNFLVGPDGSNFAAFTGADLSDLSVVEDVPGMIAAQEDHWLAPMLDHGGLICLMEPPHAGEFVVFAWVPIEESEREGIIAELEAQGYERAETEGGTELVPADAVTAESYLVTNGGWYYSTQIRGAVYLRTVFED